jgi:hypothetical protein
MIILFLTILYAVAFIFDYLPIMREKNIKVNWIYGAIFAASMIVIFLHELGVKIPSPAKPIKYFITSVLNLK